MRVHPNHPFDWDFPLQTMYWGVLLFMEKPIVKQGVEPETQKKEPNPPNPVQNMKRTNAFLLRRLSQVLAVCSP